MTVTAVTTINFDRIKERLDEGYGLKFVTFPNISNLDEMVDLLITYTYNQPKHGQKAEVATEFIGGPNDGELQQLGSYNYRSIQDIYRLANYYFNLSFKEVFDYIVDRHMGLNGKFISLSFCSAVKRRVISYGSGASLGMSKILKEDDLGITDDDYTKYYQQRKEQK